MTLFICGIVAGVIILNMMIAKEGAALVYSHEPQENDVSSSWIAGILLGLLPNLVAYALVILHLKGVI